MGEFANDQGKRHVPHNYEDTDNDDDDDAPPPGEVGNQSRHGPKNELDEAERTK